MLKCINLCLNHKNNVCKSIVSSKLYCVKSKFGSNDKYLSCNMDFHSMLGIPTLVS